MLEHSALIDEIIQDRLEGILGVVALGLVLLSASAQHSLEKRCEPACLARVEYAR